MKNYQTLIALLLSLLCLPSKSDAQHQTFYIGHSGFGWDLIVGEMVNDLAADAAITTYDYNFQFIGGTCISYQWTNSATPQGGVSAVAELPNGYDVVVLAEQIPISEVINSHEWGCELTSVEAVDNFYDLTTAATPNARIYLMEFHNEVNLTGSTPFTTWSNMNTAMRPLWEQVADSVSLINPGGPQVCIIPVAAAFEALADSVIAGTFPGYIDWLEIFDPTDIPEATIHPTEETFYLVACVHYACIFGQSPEGLTNITMAADGWPFDPPSPAQAQMMQEIAWEIVSNDPYACLQSVGLDEKETFDFSIFPNPSEGIVNFEFGETNSGQLEVFDFSGRIVYKHTINSNYISMNLETGIWLVRFIAANGTITNKRLIVR
ncbi:T9SS type A sorting domain-containing protein [Crocinitomix catalasitica]|nr:T9SS type A sorting domain-containing protein [Crocinitomix catalasitica]